MIEQLQFTGGESLTSSSNKVKLSFNHPVKELVWCIQKDEVVSSIATASIYGPQWYNYTTKADTSGLTGSVINAFDVGMTQATSFYTPFLSVPLSTSAANNSNANSLWTSNPVGWSACNVTSTSTLALFDLGINPVVTAKIQLNGHDRFSERDGRYFNLLQPFQHHENVPAVGINVYSFALKPEEHQPSGSCNMSRVDNTTLALNVHLDTFASTLGSGINTATLRVFAINYNVLRIMSGMGGLAYAN